MFSDRFAAASASRIGLAVSSGRTISVCDMMCARGYRRRTGTCASGAGACRRLLELDAVQLGVHAVARQQARRGCPASATTPSLSTMILSASRIVDRRCAMVMTVRPFISRSRPSMTRRSDSVSSAAVGSSRIRIGVLRITARAMPMRCRWPPDKRQSAFADHRVVAVRHLGDELVGVGELRGGDDFGLGRARPAIGDVLADRAAEQHRVLQHEADLAAQRRELGVVPDVDAVDQHAAGIGVVEARRSG